MYATLLADTRFHELLLAIDRDLADSCRTEGCALCGGRLHSARYPRKPRGRPCRLGEVLYDLMAANDWIGVDRWARRANDIAPTIVGGSKKHGGPDLGPSGARNAWAALGVKGTSLADDAPARDYVGMPRLTIPMVARLQAFRNDWHFESNKTARYRQVGNAFPPPVAEAFARQIKRAIEGLQPRRAIRTGRELVMT